MPDQPEAFSVLNIHQQTRADDSTSTTTFWENLSYGTLVVLCPFPPWPVF
jgi:hypothetical protein